jgi:hypothetical protein
MNRKFYTQLFPFVILWVNWWRSYLLYPIEANSFSVTTTAVIWNNEEVMWEISLFFLAHNFIHIYTQFLFDWTMQKIVVSE